MNKRFNLLIAIIFVAVQTLSVMHMAEHGFLAHKHFGKSCDIASFCEHNKISSADKQPPLPVYYGYSVQNIPETSLPELSAEYSSAIPRAPPSPYLS